MPFFRLLAVLLFAGSTLAQEPESMPPPADVEKNLQTLRILVPVLQAAESELAGLQVQIAEAATESARIEATERVDAQRERVRKLRANVRIVASGVEDSAYLGAAEEAANVGSEFRDLLKPVLDSAREATAKPREMAELRSQLEIWAERETLARAALERVEQTIAAAEDAALLAELEETRKLWSSRLDEALSQTGTLSRQIEEREAGTPRFWEFVSNGISTFWKTRGMNLLIAALIAIAVYIGTRRLYSFARRFSPLHRGKADSLFARAFDLGAFVTAILLAFFAAILVFYLRGDWLILTLAVILVVGLLWASKEALPPYLDQLRIILNLGPVRQGERLVFEGIPWRVDRLNFYCEFSNPDLAGAILRLPVRDVMPLHSRPVVPKEPWFPTQADNWVRLADGTYGKVIQQTPEMVVVLRLGGSLKTYPTADFLEQNPENLSHGFRIAVIFGIDYQHQEICTTEVPEIFQQALEQRLTTAVERGNLRSVKVEFASAGASSLDYEVLADFTGEVASRANVLERLIQKTCVEVCNERQWVIPFTQVTVHQA